jgi:glycosyltransferase involved in cell wall biosynthesis
MINLGDIKMIRNIAILIPALNPDQKLVNLVKKLKQIGLVNVVVIDDGSDSSSQAVFEDVETNRS